MEKDKVIYSVFADDEKVSIGIVDRQAGKTSRLTITRDGQVRTSFSQKDHPYANADIFIGSAFSVEKLSALFATVSGVRALTVEFPDDVNYLSFNYVSGAEPVCIVSGERGEEIHRGFDAVDSIYFLIDRLYASETDELERTYRRPGAVRITAVVQDSEGNTTVFRLSRDEEFNWSVVVNKGRALTEEHEPGTLKAEKEAHRILKSLLESLSLQYLAFYPVYPARKSRAPEQDNEQDNQKKNKRPRTGPGM